MNCDCSQLEYGALLVLPLEFKTILGAFNQDFILNDVLFDLYNHPNGAASKACGFVWNTLPNQWSRLLLGGTVNDAGRQYHLESGILCPKNSYLSIGSCYFVNEPTALLSARVMGCYCENDRDFSIDTTSLRPQQRWKEIGWENTLDPLDPTGGLSRVDIMNREVLASDFEAVEAGELTLKGSDREINLPPGSAIALRMEQPEWSWLSQRRRTRSKRTPKGTNLVVVRRTVDGMLLHWVMYHETTPEV